MIVESFYKIRSNSFFSGSIFLTLIILLPQKNFFKSNLQYLLTYIDDPYFNIC